MSDWSARDYLMFEDERTRPSLDLLAAVPTLEVKTACDLGCGPGNSTEVVLRRYPEAAIVGVDNSPDMIAAARKRLPAVRFELADLARWAPERPADLVFSNATLQWLPDHAALAPRLLGLVAPGGSLAIQMPRNLDEPSHRAMREVAAAGPWAQRLAQVARTTIGPPAAYYDLLRPLCRKLDIWITTYQHPLAGTQGVVDWLKSTGLRPYLDPLDPAEREAFLALYRQALAEAYPPQADGRLLLPFPRLFIVAQV